jgi:hypothetical protein
MARPRGTVKDPEEKFLSKSIRVPPALWAEIERRVPARKRLAFIRRAIERELGELPPQEGTEIDVGDSILRMVEEVWNGVPDEESACLPSDLSEHLDHYLYGTPRPWRVTG